jgi:sulfhydrogenase subunit delta
MSKPRVAVFKFTSCSGCQLEILNLENDLLDVLNLIDLTYFPMASRSYSQGPFDIGLVEGAITTPEEIEAIKDVRKQIKTLIALGTCACYGGLPSMKNWQTERESAEKVYDNPSVIHSVKAYGIDEYVKVDAYLKGCPINKDELVEFIKGACLDIKPYLRPHSVCVECRLKENPCLFITKGKVCLGPVTSAGCNALCPTLNRPCEGCRGPANDPNVPSLARTMAEYGLTQEEVQRKFRKYAGETQDFKKGAN